MDDGTQQFLLAEFELLAESRRSLATFSLALATFVLTFATATGGALIYYLTQADRTDAQIYTAIMAAGALAVPISWPVVMRSTHCLAQSRQYARGLNRIRRHFLQSDPSIEPALIMTIDGTRPSILGDEYVATKGPWAALPVQSLAVLVVGAVLVGAGLTGLTLLTLDLGNREISAVVTVIPR